MARARVEVSGRARVEARGDSVTVEPEGDLAVEIELEWGSGAQAQWQAYVKPQVRAMLADYARRRGGPFTLREAARDLGVKYSSVKSAVIDLVKKGVLRRVGPGTYEAAKK